MLSPDPSNSSRPQTSSEESIVLRSSGAATETRAGDADFVLSLARTSFLAYGSYDKYLNEWFHDSAVSTVVAELGGRPVGFFMMTSYQDVDGSKKQIADLVAIAVEAPSQSRGVGNRLLARAVELARAAQPPAREVWLVVADGNSRAQRFFSRRGFRLRDGVGVYPAGQRALRMVKSLEEES